VAPRAARLWRHRDFLPLWGGQTVSQVGSQLTQLALPLIAVLTLNATPGQMGLLFALQNAAYLLVGLPRRPSLIATASARAVLLGSISVAALLTIRTREDRSPIARDQPLVGAIRAGLRPLFGHRLLRQRSTCGPAASDPPHLWPGSAGRRCYPGGIRLAIAAKSGWPTYLRLDSIRPAPTPSSMPH
jgi:hypothetical protein